VLSFLESRDPDRAERAEDIVNPEARPIRDPSYRGLTLSGRVPGTHADYYRAEVTFREPKERFSSSSTLLQRASFSCTCPDWGNPCKHVGALLLHWSRHPGSFKRLQTREELVQEIGALPKEHLVNALRALAEADDRLLKRVDEAVHGKSVSDLDEEDLGESDRESNEWDYW